MSPRKSFLFVCFGFDMTYVFEGIRYKLGETSLVNFPSLTVTLVRRHYDTIVSIRRNPDTDIENLYSPIHPKTPPTPDLLFQPPRVCSVRELCGPVSWGPTRLKRDDSTSGQRTSGNRLQN